jgi:hypothetical protein
MRIAALGDAASTVDALRRVRHGDDAEARAIALALVAGHPDACDDDLGPWRRRASLGEIAGACLIAEALARRWIARHAAAAPDDVDGARALVELVARTTTNQLQVRAEIRDNDEDPWFWATTGFRLLRGFLSCIGQAQLVARLLARRFAGVHLVRTAEIGGDNHTLVRLRLDGAPVFADAWASVPLFALDEPDAARAGVPSLAALAARGLGRRDGIFPDCAYRGARWLPPLPIPSPLGRRPVTLDTSRGPDPTPDERAAFLRARVEHVFGDASRAPDCYLRVAAGDPSGWCARVARRFLETVEADGTARG